MNEQLLRELADKLGQTAEGMFNVLVAQAQVAAVAYSLKIAVAVVIVLLTIFLWRKAYAAVYAPTSKYDQDALLALAILFVFVDATFISLTVGWSYQLATCLYNPYYWALQEVLHTVGK